MRVSRDRPSISPVIIFFITVIAIAAASFAIAFVWQNAQESRDAGKTSDLSEMPDEESPSDAEEPSYDTDIPSEDESMGVSSGEAEPEEGEEPDGESSEDSEPGDDSDSGIQTAGYAREAVDGAVPQSQSVGYDYFDDAIFFGDSISVGIPLYMSTVVPNAAVIAMQGVSPIGASESQCIDVGGTKVTMLEAAKTKGDRKKVYIMLGANGLELDETSFMKGYRTFVKSVKEMYPDSIIYIQSMLPVTRNVNEHYSSPSINNEHIREYNSLIRAMARDEGVYYLDVAQCMVDAEGYLPTEVSKLDGMHLSPEYYIRWFDYLRTHTVK